MKQTALCWLILFLAFTSFRCSQENNENSKILAQINDCKIPFSEFESKLKADLELEKDYKQTRQGKLDFLEELIKKEILIQEAKKLDLDRKVQFVRAMERYWESTLIRDLFEIKSNEINKEVSVTQDEIKARYDDLMKIESGLPPLEDIQASIESDIKEEKKTALLQKWLTELRSKSTIQINNDLLK